MNLNLNQTLIKELRKLNYEDKFQTFCILRNNQSLSKFNDYPETKHEHVMKLFDDFIETLESK